MEREEARAKKLPKEAWAGSKAAGKGWKCTHCEQKTNMKTRKGYRKERLREYCKGPPAQKGSQITDDTHLLV